jgi:quinoprotein relay system zinc metallohydrolase 2
VSVHSRAPRCARHGVGLLLALGFGLYAGLSAPAGAAGAGAPLHHPLALTSPAPGIYVHAGRHEEPDAHNLGDVANIGFVVGTRCVAVIDTGASLAVGQALREAVRARTPLPVCHVINTHMHPDHVMGNAAFEADRPQFIGHARLPAALAVRAHRYTQAMRRDIGPGAEGSRVIGPTVTVDPGQPLSLDLGGRTLTLQAWPVAHTDTDLTVRDEASGTLFTGDLLFLEHMPVIDGRLNGWLALLAQWQAGPVPARVVPGHGTVDAPWAASLARQQQYLAAVQTVVREALARHLTLSQMLASPAATPPPGWLLPEAFHQRNLTAAFAELEWE